MVRRFLSLALPFALAAGCNSSEKPAASPSQVQSQSQATAASVPSHSVSHSDDSALQAALDGPQRSEENRARDKYRHPAETLAFFGLKADQTVVELYPGGGWYTEILAPYLAPHGKLIVTGSKAVANRIDKEPNVFGKVELHRIDPKGDISLGPDGSADLVLTFRNVHNWLQGGYADKIFAAAARVLKKGGTLGVAEHRGNPNETEQQIKDTGYVPESVVIDLAKKAGLELAARSEINANPKDNKDHEGGVWALPPTFENKDKDRDKYLAIGESDRMTLKFTKP